MFVISKRFLEIDVEPSRVSHVEGNLTGTSASNVLRKMDKILFAAFALCFSVANGRAQTFVSGSTGSDGDLSITTPGVTVFDPRTFGPPVNPADSNIFNFKTITIAAGSTLKLSGANFAAPVYFLAQGDVTINGTIDLNGQDGSSASLLFQRTGPTIPGAGGYAGGAGGSPGFGPGVGQFGTGCYTGPLPAFFTGNKFLVPLIGGSGGAGYGGSSGGAGGGAILIASSTSITVNGLVSANAGAGVPNGPSGSGGAIRFLANTIGGIGTLSVQGGAPTNIA